MLENLPVETIHYRLSEEEQVYLCCGEKTHEMSTQIRRETYMSMDMPVTLLEKCRACRVLGARP